MDVERPLVLSCVPGWLRVFGSVFFAAGAYGMVCMLFGLGHMTVSINDGPSRPATPGDAWLPAVFVLMGLGIMLVRYRVVIDVGRRARVTTKGWGWWVWRSELPLATATGISVGQAEERGSGSGRYTAIPVSAVGPDGKQELAEPRTMAAARVLAQRIASALDLPVDSASSELRPASDLDRPLAEVASLDPAELRPPPASRLTVEERMDGIEIRYPPAGVASALIAILVPLVIALPFWWLAWRPGLVGPAADSWVLWWFMMAPLLTGAGAGLIGAIGFLRSGPAGGRIRIGDDGRISVPGRTFASAQLRALDLVPPRLGGGLQVVLADAGFVIAKRQSPADLRYLRALVLQQLQRDRQR